MGSYTIRMKFAMNALSELAVEDPVSSASWRTHFHWGAYETGSPLFLKTLAPFRVFLPRWFGWMPQYETHSDYCQGRSPLVLLNYNCNAENSQIQESNPKPTMHATQVCIACFPCRLEPILKSTLSHTLAVRDKIRKDLR